MSRTKGFRLTLHDVTRDENQGNYGHRRRLDDPTMARICAIWDRLVISSDFAGEDGVRFGSIETGGAHPQCFSVFLGEDFTQTHLFLRKHAPYTDLRHLWRCANGNNLVPTHPDDLFFLLELYAKDMATEKAPLTIKAFDSQGLVEEMQPTIAMVRRFQTKGFQIFLEMAFPYSQAKTLSGYAIYPHAMIVERMLKALAVAREEGLALDTVKVSLKDMVGEIDEDEAYRLTKAAIQAFKESGYPTPIGLHTHDTGLALRAYLGALRAAYEEDWPIHVDIVGGRPIAIEGVIEKPGFVHPLDLLDALAQEGIPASILPQQRSFLEAIDRYQEELSRRAHAVRIPEALQGADLRRYGIPGGGQADFVVGVRQKKIAEHLQLSEGEALHVAGHGLCAVAEVMGYPLPVTPGFKNKQTAALHLIDEMFRQGDLAAYLGRPSALQDAILQSPRLPDEKQRLLWAGLERSVQEFVAGEMPLEDPIHEGFRKGGPAEPVRLRSFLEIPKRRGLLTDGLTPRLGPLQEQAKSLRVPADRLDRVVANGLVHVTLSDAKFALSDPPCEPDPSLFPNREALRAILDAGRLQKLQKGLSWKQIQTRIFQPPQLAALLLEPATKDKALELLRLGLSASDILFFLQSLPKEVHDLTLRLLHQAAKRHPSLKAFDAVVLSLFKHAERHHALNRFYGTQAEEIWLYEAEKILFRPTAG